MLPVSRSVRCRFCGRELPRLVAIYKGTSERVACLGVRGGDFELYLGQDVSIGYLSHDATSIEHYSQESLTFLVQTAEAAVNSTA